MNNVPAIQIQEILTFWFTEITPKQHFIKDLDFDALITSRFEWVYNRVVSGDTTAWSDTPEWLLAQIIVLDQFSRNMFRWDAKSFEHDHLALELAQRAVKTGMDKQLPADQRVFIYMPYMHSESRDVHATALQIFTQYGNENNLKYEINHKAIIDQFGRYPHRNEVLGRVSTPEEVEFLKTSAGF